MKRIFVTILSLIFVFSFMSCSFDKNDTENNNEIKNEVDGMTLLDSLKNSISDDSTVDDVITAFAEMCKTPVEEDLLLFECGVFGFSGEKNFLFDIVRQYPDGEGEYYQLRVSLSFTPDEENRSMYNTVWCDTADELVEEIINSPAYIYAKNHEIKAIDIGISQT